VVDSADKGGAIDRTMLNRGYPAIWFRSKIGMLAAETKRPGNAQQQ